MKGKVEDMKRDTGWRMLKGYKVYVEDGKVYRGLVAGFLEGYPYLWTDAENGKICPDGIPVEEFCRENYTIE